MSRANVLPLPKLRQGTYSPDWLLEPRRRSERALTAVVAEAYGLSVSTRRVEELGLRAHILAPPYTPRWNGKVEAAVGIALREWAYARAYTSNRARAIAFPRFVHSYNHRRPHGELGGLTPMQRLLADVNNVRGQHT